MGAGNMGAGTMGAGNMGAENMGAESYIRLLIFLDGKWGQCVYVYCPCS